MYKALVCLAVTATFIAGSNGCARLQAEERSIQLQDSSATYRKAIRWSEFEVAKSFVRRRDGSPFDYDQTFHEGIKVTSMEITRRKISIENLEATVTAELSYYHLDHPSVRDLVDTQVWWYDIESERWYLDSAFPPFADTLTK